jgi:hypothetical protein
MEGAYGSLLLIDSCFSIIQEISSLVDCEDMGGSSVDLSRKCKIFVFKRDKALRTLIRLLILNLI